MPAYKDEKSGKWFASFYYKDWDGQSRKKLKRGFETKKQLHMKEILRLKCPVHSICFLRIILNSIKPMLWELFVLIHG